MLTCAVLSPDLLERVPDLDAVVKGEHIGADDLVGLVSLAGDDEQVTGACPRQRAADGSFSVGNYLMPVERRTPGDARDDVGDDGLGALGAGVVGRDPDVVGEARGNGSHQRPLAAVTVTTAPEDHPEPAARPDELTPRLERPLERVRRVGVVHHHEESLAGLDAL